MSGVGTDVMQSTVFSPLPPLVFFLANSSRNFSTKFNVSLALSSFESSLKLKSLPNDRAASDAKLKAELSVKLAFSPISSLSTSNVLKSMSLISCGEKSERFGNEESIDDVSRSSSRPDSNFTLSSREEMMPESAAAEAVTEATTGSAAQQGGDNKKFCSLFVRCSMADFVSETLLSISALLSLAATAAATADVASSFRGDGDTDLRSRTTLLAFADDDDSAGAGVRFFSAAEATTVEEELSFKDCFPSAARFSAPAAAAAAADVSNSRFLLFGIGLQATAATAAAVALLAETGTGELTVFILSAAGLRRFFTAAVPAVPSDSLSELEEDEDPELELPEEDDDEEDDDPDEEDELDEALEDEPDELALDEVVVAAAVADAVSLDDVPTPPAVEAVVDTVVVAVLCVTDDDALPPPPLDAVVNDET